MDDTISRSERTSVIADYRLYHGSEHPTCRTGETPSLPLSRQLWLAAEENSVPAEGLEDSIPRWLKRGAKYKFDRFLIQIKGLSPIEPDRGGREVERGEQISRGLVVARSDAAEQVAYLVERLIEWADRIVDLAVAP